MLQEEFLYPVERWQMENQEFYVAVIAGMLYMLMSCFPSSTNL